MAFQAAAQISRVFYFLIMYLIAQPGTEPFLTKYFDPENHWQSGMVVFNCATCEYTTDGVNWQPLNEDHL